MVTYKPTIGISGKPRIQSNTWVVFVWDKDVQVQKLWLLNTKSPLRIRVNDESSEMLFPFVDGLNVLHMEDFSSFAEDMKTVRKLEVDMSQGGAIAKIQYRK